VSADSELREVLAAFGRATLTNMRQAERIAELQRENDELHLEGHHKDIKIMGLEEEKAHLVETIQRKIEAIRADETTTELEPIDVDEPPPAEPQIVRIEKRSL
jgi:hypothetical protein